MAKWWGTRLVLLFAGAILCPQLALRVLQPSSINRYWIRAKSICRTASRVYPPCKESIWLQEGVQGSGARRAVAVDARISR